MKLYRQFYFWTIERHADVVVSLTTGDANEWRKARRVEVIPNFSLMPIEEYSNCDAKRVIAAGRLSWEKGYDRLLAVWEKVSCYFPDWELVVFGNGNLQESLENVIKSKNIQNITILPPVKTISHEYANSSICVLTSYYEGFALVLLEALRHGVPCIAFDCKFGPRSIIEDGNCGYLVENGDIEQFADKLCSLMENDNRRMQFSLMAVEHARSFDVYGTMIKWKTLFEELTA
jgi:glycosyltransferase involved in cell wall biosynthesis